MNLGMELIMKKRKKEKGCVKESMGWGEGASEREKKEEKEEIMKENEEEEEIMKEANLISEIIKNLDEKSLSKLLISIL